MRVIRIILFLFVIFIFQTVILSRTAVLGAYPDLMTVSVIVFGLLYGESDGLWTGLFCGALTDLFSSTGALFVVLLPVAGMAAGSLRERVFKEQAFVIFFCVLLGSIAAYWGAAWARDAFYGVETGYFWRSCLLNSLLNACISPLILISAIRTGGYEQY